MCDELKIFPVSEIRAKSAHFGGSLHFNPYELPPIIWYGIGIELYEIDLGDNAPAPDIWGTKVETYLSLGGIVLPYRRWMKIAGSIGPIEDQGESSVYISDKHNPIDILAAKFERIQGTRFRIDLELYIAFEIEDSGFKDTKCSISVEAEYRGLSFHVPRWSDPSSIQFPDEWQIPTEYNEATVRELFKRFVDTDCYTLKQGEKSYDLTPLLTEQDK